MCCVQDTTPADFTGDVRFAAYNVVHVEELRCPGW